jgi:adenosylmethionine-8-amino-7-oxononanoate aminotransferase
MNDLQQSDRRNIWHPFTPLQGVDDPILISSAKGIYLHTHDGRKIIDAVSSWWVNLHGHSNDHIAQALSRQASVLEHVIFAGFTHEPAIQLSNNLLSILPHNQSKIFFSDNGSTAVEVALKMCLQYWFNLGTPKKKVIAIEGAYHGDTFGAMSVGERGLFTKPFHPYLFDADFIDFPTPGAEDQTYLAFEKIIKRGDVAAFIYEPLVQAAGGMRTYSADLLDKVIRLAHENNVLCIADEVFTGFGRTGKMFASDYMQSKPDVIAMSKGLTGGTLPLGVTSCSAKVLEAFNTPELTKTFFHGHSYTANPLACAAANASFELLMGLECQQAIQRISEHQKTFALELKDNEKLADVRTLGTILAIELRNEENTSYVNSIRKKIYSYFLQRNILLRPLGNVIYVLPPYIIAKDELSSVHRSISTFIQEL